jgi:hypothetical protein
MPDGAEFRQRVCDVPWEHIVSQQLDAVICPQIGPFLAKALKIDPLGRYTTEDVLKQSRMGTLRLWVSYDPERREFEMAATTQIIQSLRVRECKIGIGGGRNMRCWKDEFAHMVEAYARAVGCRYLTGGGRIGWTRAVPGWKQVGIEIAKEL